MNERIRELAIQSGLPTALDYHQKRYEKFAELIVRDVCQKLENDGMVEVAMEMKQHFGVE